MSLSRAIGATVVSMETLLSANEAYQNVYGRARSRGLDPCAASDEAWEAFQRVIRACQPMHPTPANDTCPTDAQMCECVAQAMNAEVVA